MSDETPEQEAIEEEAAEIDARDPDAPEEIAELVKDGDPADAAPPPVDLDDADT